MSKTSTLEVEFQTGLVYRYQEVPRAKFDALLKADSKGRYFNAKIRDHYVTSPITSRDLPPPSS